MFKINHKEQSVLSKDKLSYFTFDSLPLSLLCSPLLIMGLWTICIALQAVGCPFPNVEVGKFSDLSFFILSNFSFITFLAMIPFQTAEGKLSPGFYSRVVNRPWSHFGLYVLLTAAIMCGVVLSLSKDYYPNELLSPLFTALIASVVFSIFYHRSHTLRYLYQPAIVYANMVQLAQEEGLEGLWLDLYECTLKAIKDNRIGDARNFCDLMAETYKKVSKKDIANNLNKDVQSLYKLAKDERPVAVQFEKNWPFLNLGSSNPE